MNLAFSYYDLPASEREVAELYSFGLTKKEISITRNRSIHTIGNQLKQIFAKTGTRKDSELAAWYFITRYHISIDIPAAVRQFIALCMLVLIAFSVCNDKTIIRPSRTVKTARSLRHRISRKTDYFYLS